MVLIAMFRSGVMVCNAADVLRVIHVEPWNTTWFESLFAQVHYSPFHGVIVRIRHLVVLHIIT